MNNAVFFFFYNLAHQSKIIDGLVVFVAVYLPFLVVIAAGLFLLFHYKVLPSKNPVSEFITKRKDFYPFIFSAIFAFISDEALKLLVHAQRPFLALVNIHPLFPEIGYAFPSFHATFMTAIGTAVFFSSKKAGYIFLFFAFIIGVSRIVAGVHYPFDILGGFILGALVAYLAKSV